MTSQAISTFQLYRVTAVDNSGMPTLEGTNSKVLTTTQFTTAAVGSQAVCQTVRDAQEPTVVAMGVVAPPDAQHDDTDSPLVLRAGAASLALHPDGRIRMTGEDVAIDAATRMNLRAARIDLN